MPEQDRQSIYEAVTQQIVAQIEAGPEAWKASWSHTASTWAPANAQTDRHYQGINTLILALRCAERGFAINRWVTFRQAKLLGGQVRKGEKGTRIIFFKPYDDPRSAGRDDESDSPTRRVCLRSFYVFNVAQCDGLPSGEHTPPPPTGLASEVLRASGATIVDGAPCYMPTTDAVHLPPHTRFTSLADYQAWNLSLRRPLSGLGSPARSQSGCALRKYWSPPFPKLWPSTPLAAGSVPKCCQSVLTIALTASAAQRPNDLSPTLGRWSCVKTAQHPLSFAANSKSAAFRPLRVSPRRSRWGENRSSTARPIARHSATERT